MLLSPTSIIRHMRALIIGTHNGTPPGDDDARDER